MNVQGPIRKIIADYAPAFSVFADRVFPILAPQNSSYPLVVLTVVGNNPAPTKTGTSKVDNVMVEARVYASKFEDVANGDEQIRIAIDQFRGDVLFLSETTAIDGIRYESTAQGIEPETMLYMSVSNYTVRIKRDGLTGQTYSTLQYFAHDDDARAAGLQTNDIYRLSENNFYGMKAGTVVSIAP